MVSENVCIFNFVSDRIAWAFHKSGATLAIVLGISKAFDKVWHDVLLHKRFGMMFYFTNLKRL